jgi:hypothetical protein
MGGVRRRGSHKKTFTVKVKGKLPRYLLLNRDSPFKIHAVGGQVVGRGVGYKKKAAKNEAADTGPRVFGLGEYTEEIPIPSIDVYARQI